MASPKEPSISLLGRFHFWVRKRTTLQFLLYCSCMVCLGALISAPGPSLVRLQKQTDSDVAQMSGIFSGRAAGYVLGSMIGGPACDRFNGHKVTCYAMVLAAITAFLLPHLRVMWLLGIVTTVQGCAAGCFDTSCNVLCFWIFGADVGPYMQGLHFSFAFGGLVSPILIGAMIAATNSIVVPWSAVGAMTLVIGLAMFSLRKPVGVAENLTSEWTPNYKRAVVMGFFLTFAYVGAEIGTSSFIAEYSIDMGLMDEVEAAFLTSVWWCFLAVGRALAIPISLCISPKKMLLMNIVGSLIAISLLTAFIRSKAVLYFSIAMFGLFMASTFPSILSTVDQYVQLDGRGTSILVASGAVGEMLIPLLMGQLLQVFPASFPFVVLISMVFFASFFCIFLRIVRPERDDHLVLNDEDDVNEENAVESRNVNEAPTVPDLERASSVATMEIVGS